MLPQIEAFLEVARHQNLSRAAEALFLSQPTLTARLQSLEASLGELRRGVAGRLVLGAPPTVSTYTLPALLALFHAAHPGVRLAVKTGTSEEILQMVLHDQVQLGIMRSLHHAETETVPLYTDALVLIAGPGHRLAGPGTDGKARLADLAGEVLVLFGHSSSFLEFTTATFRQAGVLPRSVLELDNIEAAKKMVERGLGVSLVPASTVGAELAAGTLTRIELVDAAPVRREIVAVRRKDAGPPSGAAGLFLEMLAAAPPPS